MAGLTSLSDRRLKPRVLRIGFREVGICQLNLRVVTKISGWKATQPSSLKGQVSTRRYDSLQKAGSDQAVFGRIMELM